MKVFLALLICWPSAYCTLSKNFYDWIEKTFDRDMAERLNREDLGERGSFGGSEDHQGGTPTREKDPRDPVVFVHGVTDWTAGYDPVFKKFLSLGYLESELYGITYGFAWDANIYTESMKCEYAKQVRDMLTAVGNFTNSKVNVIAYAMGSPVARKAILGGKCVDTHEDLGDPLTESVSVYLSVAGANFGSSLCELSPFNALDICNPVNGLTCESEFLEDVNSQEHYEGSFVATMFSTNDDKIGYQGCDGEELCNIDGADYTLVIQGLNHKEVLEETLQTQYDILRRRVPAAKVGQEEEKGEKEEKETEKEEKETEKEEKRTEKEEKRTEKEENGKEGEKETGKDEKGTEKEEKGTEKEEKEIEKEEKETEKEEKEKDKELSGNDL